MPVNVSLDSLERKHQRLKGLSKSEMLETKPSSWHIAVAAEAFAAGLFARYGYDVSVQYGADQPEYDLIVTKKDIVAKKDYFMKVSVKGSQDWGWGLTQSYLARATERSGKKADYHGAIDLWLEKHGSRTVFCFVQFGDVPLDQLPRVYLATPLEVAQRLRETAKGRGDSVLYEELKWTSRAHAAGTTEKLPLSWRFSAHRIEELLADSGAVIALARKHNRYFLVTRDPFRVTKNLSNSKHCCKGLHKCRVGMI